MDKFYVSKCDYVKDLYLKDGTIFFRKSYKNSDYYVIEEFAKHSEYISSIINNLLQSNTYDISILFKEKNNNKPRFIMK